MYYSLHSSANELAGFAHFAHLLGVLLSAYRVLHCVLHTAHFSLTEHQSSANVLTGVARFAHLHPLNIGQP